MTKIIKEKKHEIYTFFFWKMGHRGRLEIDPPLHRLGLQVGTKKISTYYVGMVGQRDDGKSGVWILENNGFSLYSQNKIIEKRDKNSFLIETFTLLL